LSSWLVLVTSIIPHSCGIFWWLPLLKWKKAYIACPWKKDQWNHTIFEKNATIDKIDERCSKNRQYFEMGMLESTPKFWFFPHKYILSWFSSDHFEMEKKIWAFEVMAQSSFSIFKKFTKKCIVDHFFIGLHWWIQPKNLLGFLCCLQIISEIHIWILYKCS